MPIGAAHNASESIDFGRLGRRVVEGRFDGASMTTVVGVMLLRSTDIGSAISTIGRSSRGLAQ